MIKKPLLREVRIKTSTGAPTPLQQDQAEAEGEQVRRPRSGLAVDGAGEDSRSDGHHHRVREQAVDQCW
jgi:hypothetical protein